MKIQAATNSGRRRRLIVWLLAVAATALPTAGLLVVPSPASATTGPVFTVMNTSETPPDGVWFRNSPHQDDTNRETGFGVYMNERVEAICYSWGDAVGSYGNTVWYYSNNVTRPTVNGHPNTGYMNTHYINDGMLANQVAAGVPQCGAVTPPPPPPTDFSVMNTSETLPDGVWFRRSPSVSDTDAVTGHGVYAGDRVHLQCYSFGEAVGPYNDHLWYLVDNLTRPTVPSSGATNEGYLNAHYINDGKAADVVDDGIGVCSGGTSIEGSGSGTSGGGQVLGAATGSMPAPPTYTTVLKNGQPIEVDGVKLGTARNAWHDYGPCRARDYNTAKGWGIVVKNESTSTYHLVRNGMLFGWFDNGGGPGALGCPTSAEGSFATGASNPGTGDSVTVTTAYQQFSGGKLWWATGMDHAVRISEHAWQAIGWARDCMAKTCTYYGSDFTASNFENYCLAFVYQAYVYGAGVTPIGPAGNYAQAKQWWSSPTTSGKVGGDLKPPPGKYAVWDSAKDGHIVLSIGGGYAISTWDGISHGVHVMKIATPLGMTYMGSVSPGV